MHHERLLTLAEKLDTVSDDEFDISYFFGLNSHPGCALGWACRIPEFNAAGLTEYNLFPMYTPPSGPPCIGFNAGQKFFGMDREQTRFLFSRTEYGSHKPSAKFVADRIREMVREDRQEAS